MRVRLLLSGVISLPVWHVCPFSINSLSITYKHAFAIISGPNSPKFHSNKTCSLPFTLSNIFCENTPFCSMSFFLVVSGFTCVSGTGQGMTRSGGWEDLLCRCKMSVVYGKTSTSHFGRAVVCVWRYL